jgi:hypothetical protein
MYRLLAVAFLSLAATGCGGSRDPAAETDLQAKAQAMINGMQAELDGQFRIETDDRRLRAELDNANLAMSTPVSFCLVTSAGSTPLTAVQIVPGKGQGFAAVQLDSQAGQAVPSVIAGNKLEARQGAMASGMADCSAPLLLSATFQPDVDAPGGQ